MKTCDSNPLSLSFDNNWKIIIGCRIYDTGIKGISNYMGKIYMNLWKYGPDINLIYDLLMYISIFYGLSKV